MGEHVEGIFDEILMSRIVVGQYIHPDLMVIRPISFPHREDCPNVLGAVVYLGHRFVHHSHGGIAKGRTIDKKEND